MKRRIIPALISVLVISACDGNNDDPTPPEMKSGVMEVEADISTLVTKETFETGDQIGVYLVRYVDGSPGILGDYSNPMNVRYVFNGVRWATEDGDELILDTDSVDIYAYYPYDPGMSSEDDKLNLGAYPYRLPADQSQAGTPCDFLWSKATALTVADRKATLDFSHLFAKITICIDTDSEGDTTSFRIHNMTTSASIDLRNGTLSPGGEGDFIIPALVSAGEDGWSHSYVAVVIPQIIEAETPLFSFDYGGETLLYFVSDETEFLPGCSYTFYLTVGTASTLRGDGSGRLLRKGIVIQS